MTNHESNDGARRELTNVSNLSAIRASSLIRQLSFDIRHFSPPLTED